MRINRIIKPEHFDKYTIVPNAIFRYKNISMGATGLYAWLFSHNAQFNVTVEYISGHFKDGRDGILSKLKELEVNGFLQRETIRFKGKFAGYNYILSDKPKTEKPETAKPYTEKPEPENPEQSNTNTNSKVYNKRNTKKEYSKEFKIAYEHIVKLFPERTRPNTTAQKEKWLKTIEWANNKNNVDPRSLYILIQKTREDEFWCKNFLSIIKLTKRNKDGVLYLDVFIQIFMA
jgi:hypothetical protein